MVPAGAAAQVQGFPIGYLALLAIISSLGRSVGASILYWISDKLEDLAFGGNRKFLGFSHKDVERFGAYLGTKGRRKLWIALFAMHAIPVFPGALLSLGCGFIKVPFDIFVSTTFFGSIVGALFYLVLGYAGLQTALLFDNLNLASQIVIIVIVIALGVVGIYWYLAKRRKAHKDNHK